LRVRFKLILPGSFAMKSLNAIAIVTDARRLRPAQSQGRKVIVFVMHLVRVFFCATAAEQASESRCLVLTMY